MTIFLINKNCIDGTLLEYRKYKIKRRSKDPHQQMTEIMKRKIKKLFGMAQPKIKEIKESSHRGRETWEEERSTNPNMIYTPVSSTVTTFSSSLDS